MGMSPAQRPDSARRPAVEALETEVVTALNAAIGAFDRLAQRLAYGVEPAAVAPNRFDARRVGELRKRTVAMLARARPSDLRRVAAVLHATGCLQRLGARLALLDGLAPSLVGAWSGDDRLRQAVELELIATRRWLVRARDAVSTGAGAAPPRRVPRAVDGGPGRSVLALAEAAQARGPSGSGAVCALSSLADVLDHISVDAGSIAGGLAIACAVR